MTKRKRRTSASKFGSLVGASAAMREVYSMIRKAARLEVPVLIVGETGTGKDLVAREIHNRGARREGPFVAVNMGALSSELIRSEIFGHAKGAFTGALQRKAGRFEEANGGTLFLDEVATMDERSQVTLLRVLGTGKFRRVGGSRDHSPDVRVLAATNANLRHAVRKGNFREDLLHRLEVLRLALPPLRRRKADIPLLAEHFLGICRSEFEVKVLGFAKEVLRLMRSYGWPGNVRELKNVVAQAAIMAEDGEILPDHLPARVRDTADAATHPKHAAAQQAQRGGLQGPGEGAAPAPLAFPPVDGVFLPVGISMNEAQRAFVLKTLAACGHNKTRAARMLGISRKALYDWLGRWGQDG